jgi:CDP-diacylglycerol--serine O-phosphatidyltransferase
MAAPVTQLDPNQRNGSELKPKRKPHRGIYLLPNLFTTAAMFAGFYAIVAAMNGRFEPAAEAIFIAMILDSLDGRIARLTHTQSEFGAQYDSLSDMMCFGIAPALIMYEWSLFSLGKLGWLGCFMYAASVALRLARFNTQIGVADKRYFQGLPSPSGAALVVGLIWVGTVWGFRDGKMVAFASLFITVSAALLMVSIFRYYSFKEFDFKGRITFFSGLLVVLVFVLIAMEHELMLFLAFFAYALSGPIYTLRSRRQRRAERKLAAAQKRGGSA